MVATEESVPHRGWSSRAGLAQINPSSLSLSSSSLSRPRHRRAGCVAASSFHAPLQAPAHGFKLGIALAKRTASSAGRAPSSKRTHEHATHIGKCVRCCMHVDSIHAQSLQLSESGRRGSAAACKLGVRRNTCFLRFTFCTRSSSSSCLVNQRPHQKLLMCVHACARVLAYEAASAREEGSKCKRGGGGRRGSEECLQKW